MTAGRARDSCTTEVSAPREWPPEMLTHFRPSSREAGWELPGGWRRAGVVRVTGPVPLKKFPPGFVPDFPRSWPWHSTVRGPGVGSAIDWLCGLGLCDPRVLISNGDHDNSSLIVSRED